MAAPDQHLAFALKHRAAFEKRGIVRWGTKRFYALLMDRVQQASDTLGQPVDVRVRTLTVLSSAVEGLAPETVITLDGNSILVREIRAFGDGRMSYVWYIPA